MDSENLKLLIGLFLYGLIIAYNIESRKKYNKMIKKNTEPLVIEQDSKPFVIKHDTSPLEKIIEGYIYTDRFKPIKYIHSNYSGETSFYYKGKIFSDISYFKGESSNRLDKKTEFKNDISEFKRLDIIFIKKIHKVYEKNGFLKKTKFMKNQTGEVTYRIGDDYHGKTYDNVFSLEVDLSSSSGSAYNTMIYDFRTYKYYFYLDSMKIIKYKKTYIDTSN